MVDTRTGAGRRPTDGDPTVVRALGAEDAELLEHLARRDPVHPLRDRADLIDRTDADRAVFALWAGGRRPATVVWVALCAGAPTAITELLDPGAPVLDPATADTAAFYSIWNVGSGPTVPGGARRLIETAAALLRQRLPGLTSMVTLSPAPALAELLRGHHGATAPGDPAFRAACARALVSRDADGRLREPVARFHLGNGARLWRVNLAADPSPAALRASHGVMVNYRYEPEDRAANRALLAQGGVATSAEVAALLGP